MASVQLKDGSLRDQVRFDLYDSLYMPATTSWRGIQSFFSNANGKTIAESNMKLNGTLENQVSFLIQGISLDAMTYVSGLDAVVAEIVDYSALVLTIGDKDYYRGPARHVAGKIRTYNPIISQLGSNRDSIYKLHGEDAIPVPSVQTFALKLHVETDVQASAKIKFVGTLRGLMRRPAQ